MTTWVAATIGESDHEAAPTFVESVLRRGADEGRTRAGDEANVVLFERGQGKLAGQIRMVCWDARHRIGCRCGLDDAEVESWANWQPPSNSTRVLA